MYIVVERKGEEFFIPIHRIHKIHSEGKILFQKELEGEKLTK